MFDTGFHWLGHVGRAQGVLRLGAVLVFGALVAASPARAQCDHASPEEAHALALRAAELVEEVGAKDAFFRFMDPSGPFIERDLYVFALDLEGNLWASGAYPAAIGSNAWEAQDSDGRWFVQEMIHLAATKGEGWVEYDFFDPCTGKLSPKVSFVKRVGDFIIGVGAYGTRTI